MTAITKRAQDQPSFLTVLEVANYLRVSRRKAYDLVSTGEIPSIRVGGSLRIPREQLDQCLSAALKGPV